MTEKQSPPLSSGLRKVGVAILLTAAVATMAACETRTGAALTGAAIGAGAGYIAGQNAD